MGPLLRVLAMYSAFSCVFSRVERVAGFAYDNLNPNAVQFTPKSVGVNCSELQSFAYDNLNPNASVGVNCSEVLDKLVTKVDYSVEDFTDYSQDTAEPKYAADIPKSRQARNIKRVLSWVGRGFGKVFNSPYIYNFYPIINYSVGKIMQHLPFLGGGNNSPSGGPPSPDYPQTPSSANPQQLQQQQQMQQEYEEEMEKKKEQEMEAKQKEEEAKAKALEEKKQINERAKKLAAKYVELYFSKQAQISRVTFFKTPSPPNYLQGAYNGPPLQAYNGPAYDQPYAPANYLDPYSSLENPAAPPAPLPPVPPVYNPAPPVDYV